MIGGLFTAAGVLLFIIGLFAMLMSGNGSGAPAVALWVAGGGLILFGRNPALIGKGPASARKQREFGVGYKYAFLAGDGTGIAVDPTRRVIKLQETNKVVREYFFEQVRSWRRNHERSDPVPGLGTAVQINRQNRHRDLAVSGLFVEVKDVDHPIWRIGIQDLREQQRWHEILTQTINEGAA